MSASHPRVLAYAKNASSLTPPGEKSLASGTSYVAVAAATIGLLAFSAYVNHRLAKRAERDNPPIGRFIYVDGARLHVIEKGTGEPLVLLHGNSSMVEDFVSSGLIDMAASRYRVIAIDRPGHGHSTRPRNAVWTDVAQANLIAAALSTMAVSRAVVLGHSLGSAVALALALDHPKRVSGLVLVSGYFYPTLRADALATWLNIPIVGTIMRNSISPWLSRAMWPGVVRKLFGPAPTPSKFEGFPKEMTFRPSQIRASAGDAVLMVVDAAARQSRYEELKAPVVMIAGEDDRMVDVEEQSGRLHAALPQSALHRITGAGHMLHQTATNEVMSAIDEAARAGKAVRVAADRNKLSAAE